MSRDRMKRIAGVASKRVWIAGGLAAIAVIAVLLRPARPAPRYETAPVTRADVENFVLATGVVQPIRQVDVGTRVTGQLKALKAGLGDHVRQGQLLAEIDPALPENELRAAQANLAKLEADRASAVAKEWRSRLERDRQRGMIKSAATSRRDVEGAEAQALADQASIRALDAQIAEARSREEIAAANLGYTKITAPIEGDVVGVLTQEGQTVVAAQIVPVILKLAKLDFMTIRTQISEADVIHVAVGQPVSFTIMGDPDTKYLGALRAVEPAPQNYSDPAQAQGGAQSSAAAASGSAAVFYNALFDIANPTRMLRIGMTVQVSITLGVVERALSIPATALRDQEADGRYRLLVVDAAGHATPRLVRIGVDNHARAEVLDGLAEGEIVVVSEIRAAAAAGSAP